MGRQLRPVELAMHERARYLLKYAYCPSSTRVPQHSLPSALTWLCHLRGLLTQSFPSRPSRVPAKRSLPILQAEPKRRKESVVRVYIILALSKIDTVS